MWVTEGSVPRCRAPFTSMEFGPDGSVLACCANYLYPLGTIGDGTLRDIWTGPAAERLRAALRAGDLSLGCTICRHRIRHDGAELPLLAYEHLEPTEGGEWPTVLSFSLHNTCNLECIMCGADRSSRIRTRRLGLPPLPHRYDDAFFDQLGEFIAHASSCDFVGGEPLLIRDHWRVWDIMRRRAPGIPCAITTNGTVWNRRVEALLDDFPTTVRISMDGITAATFERVRVGADHGLFSANLERFVDYTRSRGTELTIVWSFVRQNWFELGEALVWAEERGIPVYVTTVIEHDFGVQHLPTDQLRTVHDRMTHQSDEIRPLLSINGDTWDRQIDMVATELADRAVGRVRDACFDPPTDDAGERAARAITGADWSLGSPEADPGVPDTTSYASAWGLDLDACDRVVCDLSGRIVALQRGRDDLLSGVVPGTHALEDVFDLLCSRLGGRLWRLEELPLSEGFVTVVAVGADERDGTVPQVVRLLVHRRNEGDDILLEVAVVAGRCADRTAVPVSIGPS